MKKTLLFLFLVPLLGISQNQYTYGFDGTTEDLSTAGWVRTNQSSPSTATLWTVASYTSVVVNSASNPPVANLPFGDEVLPNGATCPPPSGQAGGENSFALVNFTSTTGNNTISNWLITPVVNVQNGDIVSFYTRLGKIPGSTGTQYPDRLQLRMSDAGSNSTDPASGSVDLGSFTALLVDVNPELQVGVYPQTWTQYTATISGLSGPTEVKFAFRYFVTSGGPNGDNSDIIGIDTFSVDRPLSSDEFFTQNLTLYPNPASDVLNLSSSKTSINAVKITDLNGRIVRNIEFSNVASAHVNVSDLMTGMYIISVEASEGTGTSKFVKN